MARTTVNRSWRMTAFSVCVVFVLFRLSTCSVSASQSSDCITTPTEFHDLGCVETIGGVRMLNLRWWLPVQAFDNKSRIEIEWEVPWALLQSTNRTKRAFPGEPVSCFGLLSIPFSIRRQVQSDQEERDLKILDLLRATCMFSQTNGLMTKTLIISANKPMLAPYEFTVLPVTSDGTIESYVTRTVPVYVNSDWFTVVGLVLVVVLLATSVVCVVFHFAVRVLIPTEHMFSHDIHVLDTDSDANCDNSLLGCEGSTMFVGFSAALLWMLVYDALLITGVTIIVVYNVMFALYEAPASAVEDFWTTIIYLLAVSFFVFVAGGIAIFIPHIYVSIGYARRSEAEGRVSGLGAYILSALPIFALCIPGLSIFFLVHLLFWGVEFPVCNGCIGWLHGCLFSSCNKTRIERRRPAFVAADDGIDLHNIKKMQEKKKPKKKEMEKVEEKEAGSGSSMLRMDLGSPLFADMNVGKLFEDAKATPQTAPEEVRQQSDVPKYLRRRPLPLPPGGDNANPQGGFDYASADVSVDSMSTSTE